MIGYIFACLAVFCNPVKGYCGKKVGAYADNIPTAVKATFIRMVLCTVIGFGIAAFDAGPGGLLISKSTVLIAALSGIINAIFLISWMFAVQRGAYMLVDCFMSLGVALPIILSHFLYRELIDGYDALGFSVLLCGAFLLYTYSNKEKRRLSFTDFLLLALMGGTYGLYSFTQKMFVYHGGDCSASVFNFYSFAFSAIALTVVFALFSTNKTQAQRIKPLPRRIYVYVTILAVALFLNSYFNTLAAEHLTSAQLYPLSQGMNMILSALMASVCFGEKIKPRLMFGLLLAFAGVIIMNLF